MQVHDPIFLNCFSRGGSNILWNIYLSHPDVVSPIRETLEIFRTGVHQPTMEGYVAALLSGQPHLFDQWTLAPRRPINGPAQGYIDRTLFRWQMKTLDNADMRWKSETERYTPEEVAAARLCAKNNNGIIFLSDRLLEMYPTATFVALIREPFALYEGHVRHHLKSAAEDFAGFYNAMLGRMLDDQARFPSYHILKFEDLLADPLGTVAQLYAWARLDPARAPKLRFKAKPHLNAAGERTTTFQAGKHYWFGPDEIYQFLDPKINDYQSDRISAADRETILRLTEPVLARAGYRETANVG